MPSLFNLIEALDQLSERDLIFVLNNVFHNIKQKGELNEEENYVFAKSSFDSRHDEYPYMECFGLPMEEDDKNIYSEAYGSGKCQTCNSIVVCIDKRAICPVCGQKNVECT